MAHFAELDQHNKVIRVIVINNAVLLVNGEENEQKGIDFCKSLYGNDTQWAQCSYNSNFRNFYPAVGDTFDTSRNAFVKPQPHPSFMLGQDGNWHAPVTRPTDGKAYVWNEFFRVWKEFIDPVQPYPSWILNTSTGQWEAPVAKPSNPATEYDLVWHEDTQGWGLENMSLSKLNDNGTYVVERKYFDTWDNLIKYLHSIDQKTRCNPTHRSAREYF